MVTVYDVTMLVFEGSGGEGSDSPVAIIAAVIAVIIVLVIVIVLVLLILRRYTFTMSRYAALYNI